MYKPDDFNNKIIDENKLISLIEPGNRIFLSVVLPYLLGWQKQLQLLKISWVMIWK